MMTKRELVENYRILVMEVEAMENQKSFLYQYIGGPRPVRSPQLTGMPRGTNDPEAALLQRQDYNDAILMLEDKCRQIRELFSEFEKILDSITDPYDRVIIRHYYALGWKDKDIAKEIGFDKSTVWRRRTRTINSLDFQVSTAAYSYILT